MVGGDVVMLVVLIPFWFRLVITVGIVIYPGLTKYPDMKMIPEGIPNMVDSYCILKWSCKSGSMRMCVPN